LLFITNFKAFQEKQNSTCHKKKKKARTNRKSIKQATQIVLVVTPIAMHGMTNWDVQENYHHGVN